MKRIVLALCFVVFGYSTAVAGLAAGTGIVGSRHDMTVVYGVNADSQQRVCAFCHTPHHAATSGNDYLPLWSHNITAENFQPYQSPTLNATITQATFLNGPSKLCFSCHDGQIAADQHYGISGSNILTGDNYGQFALSNGTGDLTNDHPIGFDYTLVAQGTDNNTPGTTNAAGNGNYIIKAAAGGAKYHVSCTNSGSYTCTDTTVTIYERLYGGTIMTCATCHDVHNSARVVAPPAGTNYFLLGGQANSAICLSCHIK